MPITAGVGICAYNEEKNIGLLLARLLKQKLSKEFKLKEIVVIASGCTDRTEEIVKSFSKKDRRVKLISEKERTGKSHAVNILLGKIKSGIFILENGDTLPYSDSTINNILLPFLDDKVGVVGGRPVPTNKFDTTAGFVNNLIWEIHHQVSLTDPKMSEIMAFRTRLVNRIPVDSVVDDASIEAVAGNSLKVYAPNSMVLNHGPDSLAGIIKQRKRICIGHTHLMKTKKYKVSTMKTSSTILPLFRAVQAIKKKTEFGASGYLKVLLAISMEAYVRVSAYLDFYLMGKKPYKWEILDSTKRVK
jgi:cellulose synthase/poly-beta-1,6-N-acetylglucosamine synthase-like glycosyltransferase